MPPKNDVKKQGGGAKAKKKTKPRRTQVDKRVLAYANLLKNPDSGPVLADGVYDGELGFFHRFVSTVTLNGVSETAGYVAFCPATGNGFFQSTSGANSTLAVVTGNASFPGAGFLQANANKTRGIACKLELIPSAASITNITGEAAAGVVARGNFVANATTVNQLFDIAKAYGPLERKVVTSRWFPSGLDHTYQPYNTFSTEDNNSVYVAYRGWPAGVPISVRVTYVVEYTPNNAVGIPPTGTISSPVGHSAIIEHLQKSDPHWHHSILDSAKHAAKGIVDDIGLAARSMVRSGLMKQAPKMLALL